MRTRSNDRGETNCWFIHTYSWEDSREYNFSSASSYQTYVKDWYNSKTENDSFLRIIVNKKKRRCTSTYLYDHSSRKSSYSLKNKKIKSILRYFSTSNVFCSRRKKKEFFPIFSLFDTKRQNYENNNYQTFVESHLAELLLRIIFCD